MLLLMFVLSTHAFAEIEMLYCLDRTPVHEEKDSDSDILQYMEPGEGCFLDKLSSSQKWAKITCEDHTYGGQLTGWVKMKHMSFTMPSSVCNHQWTDWTIIEQPTCTSKGMRTRSCPICGVGESQDIDMLPHSYGDWITVTSPTCSHEGERMVRCQVCGHEEHQTIDRLPHTFGEWVTTKGPTCTSNGERVRRCQICGYEERYTLDRLPHNYGDWTILKEATCTEEGLESHTCLDCGYEETVPIEKLPHDFKWEIIEEATDHSAGIRTNVCQVCGYKEEQVSYDPEGTLRRGDRSEEVREMQQLLADQNYLNADGADGIFGGGTEAALMKFQDDQNLTPDGVAWPQTIRRLHHDFGEWETVREMTRSTAGERVRKCKECSYEQHQILEPEPVLERGRRGENVRAAQQMLTSMGYDAGAYDGIYGQMLDNAYVNYAKAEKMEFEPGKINAEEIDAMVNSWVAAQPAEDWMGVCKFDTPVELILTVNAADDDDKNSNIRTFNWTLTNIGDEDCNFAAVLLNFDEDPQFRENNYCMVLDGVVMQARCGNSASGSFRVNKEWGEGSMKFAALGVSESNGRIWLSNINEFAAE